VAVALLAALMSVVVGAAVLLGYANPSRYQLAYISVPDPANDDRTTLYIHDLRADVRLPIVQDYLGWGSAIAWSPDGERIAFSAFAPGEVRRNIYVVDIRTRATERITGGTVVTDHNSPSWSPDGGRLAYHAVTPDTGGNIDLYIYDFASATHDLITGRAYRQFTPAWSPDGRMIAYESSQPPNFSPTIFLYDTQTGSTTPLYDTPDTNINPAWSPDGRRMVYASQPNADTPLNLYIVDIETRALRRLTSLARAQAAEPAWSPDGRMIAYVGFSVDSTRPPRLYLQAADGTGAAIPITEGGAGYRQPSWRP